MNENVKSVIKARAKSRFAKFDNNFLKFLYTTFPEHKFYIGGNSLNNGIPNDLDLYPINKNYPAFDDVIHSLALIKADYYYSPGSAKNTLSITYQGKSVQICRYIKNSLEELINSFDFSHIQVGASAHVEKYATGIDGAGDYEVIIDDVYYTDKYEESKMIGTSEFTGTDYPMSSLIRAFKYAKRDDFGNKKNLVNNVVRILTAFIDRGFKDYDDFKDQLASVDLMLEKDLENNVIRDFVAALYARNLLDKGDKRYDAFISRKDLVEIEIGDEECPEEPNEADLPF